MPRGTFRVVHVCLSANQRTGGRAASAGVSLLRVVLPTPLSRFFLRSGGRSRSFPLLICLCFCVRVPGEPASAFWRPSRRILRRVGRCRPACVLFSVSAQTEGLPVGSRACAHPSLPFST